MTTDGLIRDLCLFVGTLPRMKLEAELHGQVLAWLEMRNLCFIDQGPIPNPDGGGVSKRDVLVVGVEPQLLIEFKCDGDWKRASHAAWQLFQAARLLERTGTKTRQLAIFGSKIRDPIICEMLKALSIELAFVH